MSEEINNRKVIRESETFWQLDGESDLYALTDPNPPVSGSATTIKLTHSNSYAPLDDVKFFVCLGNPDKPTEQDDLDSAKDWKEVSLVEELVTINGEEMLRSEAEETFEDELPWEGTYETH